MTRKCICPDRLLLRKGVISELATSVEVLVHFCCMKINRLIGRWLSLGRMIKKARFVKYLLRLGLIQWVVLHLFSWHKLACFVTTNYWIEVRLTHNWICWRLHSNKNGLILKRWFFLNIKLISAIGWIIPIFVYTSTQIKFTFLRFIQPASRKRDFVDLENFILKHKLLYFLQNFNKVAFLAIGKLFHFPKKCFWKQCRSTMFFRKQNQPVYELSLSNFNCILTPRILSKIFVNPHSPLASLIHGHHPFRRTKSPKFIN